MRYLCLLILSLFVFTANAQQKLSGRVFENKTRIYLAGVRIQNLRTKKFTETDDKGHFNIDAALNDVVVFNNFGYEVDTLVLINFKPKEVFLEPKKHMLNEVNVNVQQVQSFKTYDRDFHNQTMIYQRDNNGNLKGGISLRIWSNKKEERQQAKGAQWVYTERYRLIIDTVFALRNLSKYLPLNGDELMAFRVRYMPTVPQYTSSDFNLLRYIDSCYKNFETLPADKRKLAKLK
ncbi:hypothetical protein C8P68_103167 [Mucilaginibacter yixingensis]|uniref:Carboxypeptidase-like protein n=1 Tax=Mucilaginibacter yixingensis TaxID=1295612 RepID=A0A2T5JAW7_9SPHI|nr:carboxypeptidase-like regulatory domain-containing protein [Mucilaginibacter yixingensis]PTQ98008.1 hypothetical protein C8P68_103167 [Mucilaginibacter yixingensis]